MEKDWMEYEDDECVVSKIVIGNDNGWHLVDVCLPPLFNAMGERIKNY